jgi:pimeloyl-ACP methyl ester carboxylesterase
MLLPLSGARALSVITRGAGDPAVLLHASGMGAGQWGPTVPRLAERWAVYAPNLLGYGESSPAEEPYTVADDVAAVVALLRTLDRPAHLVGHSFGGLVALEVASEVHVRSLFVYEPVAFGVIARDGSVDPALLDPALLAQVAPDEAWLAAFIDYWGGEGGWDALGSKRKDALRLTLRKSWLEVCALLQAARSDFRLVGAPPVLVAHGTRSPAAAHAIARRLAGQLGARLEVLEEAGHMAPVEEAKRCVRLLTAWFDATP